MNTRPPRSVSHHNGSNLGPVMIWLSSLRSLQDIGDVIHLSVNRMSVVLYLYETWPVSHFNRRVEMRTSEN
jgi:hypothetical protein